jgi:hypothetical protein
MTQFSFPWPGIAPGSGADAGQYTAAQWWARATAMLQTGGIIMPDPVWPHKTTTARDNLGVFHDVGEGDYAVDNPSDSLIEISPGAAIVDGTVVYNGIDENLQIDVPAPTTHPRIDLVVLRKNYTSSAYTPSGSLGDEEVPAYTVRVTRIVGTPAASPDAPDLVHSYDRTTYWDIPLAQFEIATDGTISDLTDLREYAPQWDNENIVDDAIAPNHIDDTTDQEDEWSLVRQTAGTATAVGVLSLTHTTSGTAAAGFGAALEFELENDADEVEKAAEIAAVWSDPSDGAEDGRIEIRTIAAGDANLSGVIVPPNSVNVDGNDRGSGAVDFQSMRGVATNVASGAGAFIAAGRYNTASGSFSFVSGDTNIATGDSSHAEGQGCEALWLGAHAEGAGTVADNLYAHAEGAQTSATGIAAHSEGLYTDATGAQAHAEGNETTAIGRCSHAQGSYCVAEGDYSHAGGRRAQTGANDGVFIWADSESAVFTADRADQFKVRAKGGAHFVQNSTSGALPVLTLEQQDVDEPFVKVIGDAASASETRDLVATADASETLVGFFKIEVLDDGNQITDGDYYVPFYSLSAPS